MLHTCRAICRQQLLFACLFLCCINGAGCQSMSPKGPLYKLKIPQPQQAAQVSVAVSISDKRPDTERSYQRGSLEPANYEMGIEILTLDNFEPSISEVLQQRIAEKLSKLKHPPVWADVEITRFVTKVDRREILAAEYERQLLADEAGAVNNAMRSDQGIASGVVNGAAAGLMAAMTTAAKIRQIDADRSAWDHAMFGVTCEAQLHVRIHWNDDKLAEFNLDARAHSMPQEEDQFIEQINSTKWKIGPTVEQALVQLTDELMIEVTLQDPDRVGVVRPATESAAATVDTAGSAASADVTPATEVKSESAATATPAAAANLPAAGQTQAATPQTGENPSSAAPAGAGSPAADAKQADTKPAGSNAPPATAAVPATPPAPAATATPAAPASTASPPANSSASTPPAAPGPKTATPPQVAGSGGK